MKRFAQNKKPVPGSKPSYEKEIADQKTKQFEEFKKSQQVALEFCKDLQNIGSNLKEEATKLPVQFLLVKIAMSAIGDKLDTIGKDAETIITVKLGTEIAFESGKIVSTFFQNQNQGRVRSNASGKYPQASPLPSGCGPPLSHARPPHPHPFGW